MRQGFFSPPYFFRSFCLFSRRASQSPKEMSVTSIEQMTDHERHEEHEGEESVPPLPSVFCFAHTRIISDSQKGNVSNADVLWNNILNQNIKYGPHIRIWDTTLFLTERRIRCENNIFQTGRPDNFLRSRNLAALPVAEFAGSRDLASSPGKDADQGDEVQEGIVVIRNCRGNRLSVSCEPVV